MLFFGNKIYFNRNNVGNNLFYSFKVRTGLRKRDSKYMFSLALEKVITSPENGQEYVEINHKILRYVNDIHWK